MRPRQLLFLPNKHWSLFAFSFFLIHIFPLLQRSFLICSKGCGIVFASRMDRFIGKNLDKTYGEDNELDCEQGLLAAHDHENSELSQPASPVPSHGQMVTINLN